MVSRTAIDCGGVTSSRKVSQPESLQLDLDILLTDQHIDTVILKSRLTPSACSIGHTSAISWALTLTAKRAILSQHAACDPTIARPPGTDPVRAWRISEHLHLLAEGLPQSAHTDSEQTYGVVCHGLVPSHGSHW